MPARCSAARDIIRIHRPRLGLRGLPIGLIHANRAVAGRVQARRPRQSCGFAAAGMADEADKLAAIALEIAVLDRCERAFRRRVNLVQRAEIREALFDHPQHSRAARDAR